VCFSPQADLVGGLALAAISIDVARHVHGRRDHLAFAALPLLFATHQLAEAFVWWGLQGDIPAGIGHVATWIYLTFAFVVLPIYLPLAIRALEPPGRRRNAMTLFLLLGTVVAAVLLAAMIRGPVTATLGDHHVAYNITLHAGTLIVGVYVLATCGSAVFSGYRHIAVFGVLNLIAVAVLARATIDGFASMWCGWAALTSLAIALQLRFSGRHRPVSQALA
jgi:hypothetical protein